MSNQAIISLLVDGNTEIKYSDKTDVSSCDALRGISLYINVHQEFVVERTGTDPVVIKRNGRMKELASNHPIHLLEHDIINIGQKHTISIQQIKRLDKKPTSFKPKMLLASAALAMAIIPACHNSNDKVVVGEPEWRAQDTQNVQESDVSKTVNDNNTENTEETIDTSDQHPVGKPAYRPNEDEIPMPVGEPIWKPEDDEQNTKVDNNDSQEIKDKQEIDNEKDKAKNNNDSQEIKDKQGTDKKKDTAEKKKPRPRKHVIMGKPTYRPDGTCKGRVC